MEKPNLFIRLMMKAINAIMRPLLQSRWHAFFGSDTLMVFSYTGRKTGKTRRIPIGYVEDEQGLLSFSPFGWVKQFKKPTPVTLWFRGKRVQAIAQAVTEPEVVAERLVYYLNQNPGDARYFKVKLGPEGKPIPEDIARAAPGVVMIRTHVQG